MSLAQNQTMTEKSAKDSVNQPGPKFTLNIEGVLYSWPVSTITTEQIAELGGWEVSAGVIQIDADNNELTLQPGDVVELKPGMGFSKKVRWKRGAEMDDRIQSEFDLLKAAYPKTVYQDRWVLLPGYKLGDGWSLNEADIAFYLRPPYPGISPYGIYAPQGLTFNAEQPNNFAAANPAPPFPGKWWIFSWEAQEWKPSSEPNNGHNLLTWANGMRSRFLEGL